MRSLAYVVAALTVLSAQNLHTAGAEVIGACANSNPVCEIKNDGRLKSFQDVCSARRSGAIEIFEGPCEDDD